VIVDTGSAGTVLAIDALEPLGIQLDADDVVHGIRGVGGREYVFRRQLDRLVVGDRSVDGAAVEIGGMDYGFSINGILGLDVLTRMGAVLDLRHMTIDFVD
jgi:predicted aspartyl protease